MSATYIDWNNVPAHIELKIRHIWNGLGTAEHTTGYDRNGDKVDIYKLANYNVRQNVDYLNDAQKLRLFEIACERDLILSSLLDRLQFEIETVRVHNEIYHLPSFVVGTWPHCNLYGAMDATGYVHT
jgi:hypothetical protein